MRSIHWIPLKLSCIQPLGSMGCANARENINLWHNGFFISIKGSYCELSPLERRGSQFRDCMCVFVCGNYTRSELSARFARNFRIFPFFWMFSPIFIEIYLLLEYKESQIYFNIRMIIFCPLIPNLLDFSWSFRKETNEIFCAFVSNTKHGQTIHFLFSTFLGRINGVRNWASTSGPNMSSGVT